MYKGTRQNMRVTKHNNADQTFWIFYLLCVFGFLTQKQVKIDQKERTNIQAKKKQQKHAGMKNIITQLNNVTTN